ncbi:AzlD domain-containing protein [Anaeromicrobium sediminis]|uniref:Branched-chain amino acid transporter n=1 Tax=Anaeromicrobium sediminis TaxID=1478221 RepID=A0A267MAI0_9FIRM|nr:AzlD domain-containing protein [Anaeromicrobium sediminis]PAB55918.1 hypothetical protein CCE28_21490 [Anaeromicrobium sediminis]
MRLEYIILIVLMGIVTYITRVSFLVFFNNKNISKVLNRSLKYIPASILAALIFPGVFAPSGNLDMAITNPYIGASGITIISVLLSKNSAFSIVLGIVSLVLLRKFI